MYEFKKKYLRPQNLMYFIKCNISYQIYFKYKTIMITLSNLISSSFTFKIAHSLK